MIPIQGNITAAETLFNEVKPVLEKRIDRILRTKKIKKKKKDIKLSKELADFLKELRQKENLKSLILLSPEKLIKKISTIKHSYPKFSQPKANDCNILYNIFADHGYEAINKNRFIGEFDLDTCPYCNRSYIYSLTENKLVKPEIDHFYPKQIYPLLACSYYNLIPSCQNCNGFGAKSNKDSFNKRLKNPHLLTHTDFQFSHKIRSIDAINPMKMNTASIELFFTKRIKGNDEVFNLTNLYNKHKDIVLELIVKSKFAYSPKYRAYLKSYSGLQINDSDINRLILGNYTELHELHKRPLAKLTRDIAIKLGLIIV